MEKFQIYLAGGVANEPDEGKGWREKATVIFNEHFESDDYKVVVIDPTKYFTYSDRKDEESDKQIKRFYYDMIQKSQLLLVNLDRSKLSPGTAMEVQFARDKGIEIIGFGKEDVYPWILEECQVVFPSMLSAIDYIKEYYIERR
jgi:nucleoside 2-deoxyribosyltransferase